MARPKPKPRDRFLPDVTYVVGGWNEPDGRGYGLYRNRRLLVIYAPPIFTDKRAQIDERSTHLDREYRRELERIQMMLDQLDFYYSGAFLVDDPISPGNRLIKHALNNKPPTPLCPYPLWLPLVPVSELEVTRWHLAKRSEDYRKLHERGLSHLMINAIAHVVCDGVPVGLMVEPAIGRYVRYEDRADVYEAVAFAQSKGVIMSQIRSHNMMITDSGFRFLIDVQPDFYSPDDVDVIKGEGNVWHRGPLERLFGSLKAAVIIGQYITERAMPSSTWLMPPLPRISRHIAIDHLKTMQEAFIWWMEHPDYHLADSRLQPWLTSAGLKSSKMRNTRAILPSQGLGYTHSHNESEDLPIRMVRRTRRVIALCPTPHHDRARFHQAYHPYARRATPKNLLLAPDGDTSSD
ncbi:hypothetical protein PLICRDRAFT_578527 [Plicaturopsis crispa FD-325 SS-3]|nr:hypothetical protein PLICRDRAFT_578527 [Plicaturopsis crispa FD-325 SS-3]